MPIIPDPEAIEIVKRVAEEQRRKLEESRRGRSYDNRRTEKRSRDQRLP